MIDERKKWYSMFQFFFLNLFKNRCENHRNYEKNLSSTCCDLFNSTFTNLSIFLKNRVTINGSLTQNKSLSLMGKTKMQTAKNSKNWRQKAWIIVVYVCIHKIKFHLSHLPVNYKFAQNMPGSSDQVVDVTFCIQKYC